MPTRESILITKNISIKSNTIFSLYLSQTHVPSMSTEVYRVVPCLTCIPSSATLLVEGSWLLRAVTRQAQPCKATYHGGEQKHACWTHQRGPGAARQPEARTMQWKKWGQMPLGFRLPSPVLVYSTSSMYACIQKYKSLAISFLD